MPWKNGGGETAEIAIFPSDATLDTFDWRVSMAAVAADGPFSTFPGVDRTLALLEGEGLVLLPASRDPLRIGPTSSPVSFPSELPVTAQLCGGPVVDFNVMTRHGRFRHHVSRMSLSKPADLARHGALMLILLQEGKADVVCDAGSSRLDRHDTVLLDATDGSGCRIVPREPVTACIVDLWPG